MSSLSELKAIELERIADERAAVHAAEQARIAARDAEAQAKIDAEAAKVRAAHEAALAIEHAKLDAEREARLKIEAAEAAERTRQQAILAEARLAQEMELRRAEVAKKRPTWMLVLTGLATLAAFVLIYVAIERVHATEQAETDKKIAIQKQNQMRQELDELATTLSLLETEMTALSSKTDQALKDLMAVGNAAKVVAAKAEIAKIREREREVRRQQEEARQRKLKIERNQKIDVGEKCRNQAIC